MVNMTKISELSGYSKSTISRYVNQTGYVSAVAAQKIQQIINDLDYVPNSLARNLSKGKTSLIGVIVPHMKSPYFIQIVSGIMESAFSKNYNILMLQSKYDKELELTYLEKLHRKEFDGLIFTSHVVPLAKIATYKKYGPIVCCENPGNVQISSAYTIREEAYLEVFRLIKNHNFRRIAIMLSRDYQTSVTSRLTINCYQKIFNSWPDNALLSTSVTTFSDGYNQARLYMNLQERPDVVFANSDDVAAGVQQAYIDAKISVPALIGQENQISSQLINISTVDHHFKKIGKLAFDLSLEKEIKKISLASEFIVRNF